MKIYAWVTIRDIYLYLDTTDLTNHHFSNAELVVTGVIQFRFCTKMVSMLNTKAPGNQTF